MKTVTGERILPKVYVVHQKGAGDSTVGVTLHPGLGFMVGDTVAFSMLPDGSARIFRAAPGQFKRRIFKTPPKRRRRVVGAHR